ncbi:MAG: DUF6145 family protein [Defluviitaleaceae bacterium]|nr:DUF6145 family protein [Defluviitaleaceae bacterium]
MKKILVASSVYNEKYYIESEFEKIPINIQEELKTICIKTSNYLHCIFLIGFNEDGSIYFEARAKDEDNLFKENETDEVINIIIEQNKELIESLTLWYKIFILKENIQ